MQPFGFADMSVVQLVASQKFLRGITSLTSFSDVRETQAAGVQRSLEKITALTVSEAATWLGALQEDLWSNAQAARFKEIVASKTRSVQEDNSKALAQDFTLLPFYLTDELMHDIGNPDVDSDQCCIDCVSMLRRCLYAMPPRHREQLWW